MNLEPSRSVRWRSQEGSDGESAAVGGGPSDSQLEARGGAGPPTAESGAGSQFGAASEDPTSTVADSTRNDLLPRASTLDSPGKGAAIDSLPPSSFTVGEMDSTESISRDNPGKITPPIRVWTLGNSITFGFYEWPPFSTRFRFFSKKSASMMGTEVEIGAAQLAMPASYVMPPEASRNHQGARYLEFTLEGLRPSSQYTIKITGVGLQQKKPVKGRLQTISDAEKYKRDTVMNRFVGVVALLNGRDCLVTKFDDKTGLYTVQPVAHDNAVAQRQLVRFRSEYSEQGHKAQCYTVATIFFSRWGGELRSSSTLSALDLQDKAYKAADVRAVTRAEREFELKSQLVKREMRDLKQRIADERTAAQEERRILTRAFLGCLTGVVLLALLLLLWMWTDSRAAAARQAAIIDSLTEQLLFGVPVAGGDGGGGNSGGSSGNATAGNLSAAARQALMAAAQAKEAGGGGLGQPRLPPDGGNSKTPPYAAAAADHDLSGAVLPGLDDSPGAAGGGGGSLGEQLRMLTDIYQNQVLLQLQKLLAQSGVLGNGPQPPDPSKSAAAGDEL